MFLYFNILSLSSMISLLFLCFACQTKQDLQKMNSNIIDLPSEYIAKRGIASDVNFSIALENLNDLDAPQKDIVDSRLSQYLNSGEISVIVYNSFLLQSLKTPKPNIEKYFKLFISRNEQNKYPYFIYALYLLKNNDLEGKKILVLSKQAESFDNFEKNHRELYFKENPELSFKNLLQYTILSCLTNNPTEIFLSIQNSYEKGFLTKADLEYICSYFEHNSDMLITRLIATNFRIRFKISSDENLSFKSKLYKKLIKMYDRKIQKLHYNGSKELDFVKSVFLNGQIMSTLDLIE